MYYTNDVIGYYPVHFPKKNKSNNKHYGQGKKCDMPPDEIKGNQHKR